MSKYIHEGYACILCACVLKKKLQTKDKSHTKNTTPEILQTKKYCTFQSRADAVAMRNYDTTQNVTIRNEKHNDLLEQSRSIAMRFF